MIYCILNKAQNTCKIGFSKNPQKRLQTLQTGNSDILSLKFILPGEEESEILLHDKFKEDKIRGEWFIYSDKIRLYFKTNIKPIEIPAQSGFKKNKFKLKKKKKYSWKDKKKIKMIYNS